MSPEEPRWRSLIGQIRAVQMELKRRSTARVVGLSGQPAAPKSAIMVAELRLGRRLPPSYRDFLSFSDGWRHFFDGASLLGTTDIGRVDVGSIELPARQASRLLTFGANESGTSTFAFDTSARRGDGEMPIVAWVGGLGIDCRCFTGFLATVLQLCRSELAALSMDGAAARAEPSRRTPRAVENSWSTGAKALGNTGKLREVS